MIIGDERIECGFLVGSICKANKEQPITINGDYLKLLKVVGCQSFQEYMDYEKRREAFGNQAVGKEGSPFGTPCESRETNQMPLLSQSEMGRDRNGKRQIGNKTIPMSAMQESSTCEGDSPDGRPVSDDLKCGFCNNFAVLKDCGIRYCEKCATKLGLI